MKILFHGPDPNSFGGYSGQIALNVPAIAALGHEVVISDSSNSPVGREWNGFRVLASGPLMYGNAVLGGHIESEKPDITITLLDAWVVNPERLTGSVLMPWMPLDTEPLSGLDRLWLDKARNAGVTVKPISMSRFGQAMLKDHGYDSAYVPHSIDPGIFHANPGGGVAWRQELGLPHYAFVVVMNAANKSGNQFGELSRKAFAQQLEAFAVFARRHKDAAMYLHTRPDDPDGVAIYDICEQLRLDGRITFPDPYRYDCGGYDQHWLARMYNGADVTLNASAAEGFGIPIIESIGCGTPVIATRGSAMRELVTKETGWLADSQKHWANGHRANWMMPITLSITERLERAYSARGPVMRKLLPRHGERFHIGLVAAEYWTQVLVS